MILCYGARRCNGRVIPGIGHARPVRGREIADYILLQSFRRNFSWGKSGTCTLFARTALLRAHPLNEAFRRRGDGELLVRLALAGAYAVSTPEPVIVQHITKGETEKGAAAELRYSRMLARHYKTYLRGAYPAALLLAEAEALRRKGRGAAAWAVKAMAFMLSPRRLLLVKLGNITGRRNR